MENPQKIFMHILCFKNPTQKTLYDLLNHKIEYSNTTFLIPQSMQSNRANLRTYFQYFQSGSFYINCYSSTYEQVLRRKSVIMKWGFVAAP